MAPETDQFDPWELSSGLPDDFDFTCNDAFFEFDSNYNDGQTLVLKLEGVDESNMQETTLMYPTGDGWETPDQGKTAQREDGKKKGFNKNSGIGLLIGAAVETGGGEALKAKGNPMVAAIWKNERFHMKRSEIDYGGEIGKKERLLPTAYLGPVGAAPAAAPAPATPAQTAPSGAVKEDPGTAEATPVTPAAAPAPAGAGMTATTKVALLKLGKEIKSQGGTHDTFIERAFVEVEGVMGNAEAEAAVMAAEGPDSIWAKSG